MIIFEPSIFASRQKLLLLSLPLILQDLWTVRSRGFLQDFANDTLITAQAGDETQTNQPNNDNDFEHLNGKTIGYKNVIFAFSF